MSKFHSFQCHSSRSVHFRLIDSKLKLHKTYRWTVDHISFPMRFSKSPLPRVLLPYGDPHDPTRRCLYKQPRSFFTRSSRHGGTVLWGLEQLQETSSRIRLQLRSSFNIDSISDKVQNLRLAPTKSKQWNIYLPFHGALIDRHTILLVEQSSEVVVGRYQSPGQEGKCLYIVFALYNVCAFASQMEIRAPRLRKTSSIEAPFHRTPKRSQSR